MCLQEIFLYPLDQMIIVCSLNELMENVRCEQLMNISAVSYYLRVL